MKTLRDKKRLVVFAVLVVLLALGGASIINAQSTIGYGSSITGTLTAEIPNAFYTFVGNAGDLVTARVSNVTPGLDPNLTLLLATPIVSQNDPLFPGTTDARITYRLPAPGSYTLVVGSSNGILGDFSLSLSSSSPVVSEFLAPGSYTVSIPQGSPVANFSFGVPGGVRIYSETPGFQFVSSALNCTGNVAAVTTGDANDVSFTFRNACTEPYQLSLTSMSPEMSGVVMVEIFSVDGAVPVIDPVAQPTQMPEPTLTQAPILGDIGPSDVCTISPSGSPNLRSGPGTDYMVVGTFAFGTRSNPIGQALGTDGYLWWQLPTGSWVRFDVVVARGACSIVPSLSVPPPTSPATAVPPATQTPVVITATPDPATPTLTSTPGISMSLVPITMIAPVTMVAVTFVAPTATP